MGCVLDLAALVAFFYCCQHAAESFDFAEFIEDRRSHGALDGFHPGRPAQHVHGMFKNAGLLEQDRLSVRSEPDPLFTWGGERFVGAIRMTRICGVHVSQD